MTLTDTKIRNAKPELKSKKLFDERGLYIEISPAGGKWWRLKYRIAGKEKRLSLGVYPDVASKRPAIGATKPASCWLMALTRAKIAKRLGRPQSTERPIASKL